jgi:hypothetical protein
LRCPVQSPAGARSADGADPTPCCLASPSKGNTVV